MKMEAQFQRFPSVPLADLDLLLCDGLGEQNGPAGAQMQALTSFDIRKAPLVTTGIPGPCLDGMEAIADMTEDRSSPNSHLTSLTSIESLNSSQGTPDQPHLKRWGPEWITITKGSKTSADSELRRSLRNHATDEKKPRERRKVGRPIAYSGDPNSPDLTSAERRRIMRRIANRESARRVRARRQDLLEEMSKKAAEMEAANAALVQRLGALEGRHSAMASEVQALDSNLRAKSAENESLTATVRALRKTVSLGDGQVDRAALKPALMTAPRAPVGSGFSGDTPRSVAPEPAPSSDPYNEPFVAPSDFKQKRQQSFPSGCALLTSTASAVPGGTGGVFNFSSGGGGGGGVMPPVEPIDRSFSDFLKFDFS